MLKILPKLRKGSSNWEGFSFPKSNDRPEVFSLCGETGFGGIERADGAIEVKPGKRLVRWESHPEASVFLNGKLREKAGRDKSKISDRELWAGDLFARKIWLQGRKSGDLRIKRPIEDRPLPYPVSL
jgi:hypothetical protein